MKIRVTIEMEEYDQKFRVASRQHETIPDALAEVLSLAESQRRIIQRINCEQYYEY